MGTSEAPDNPLNAGLSKPAQRALANAGIGTVATLAKKTEADIAALHGMGPRGIVALKRTLTAHKLAFKK
jgi:hypothetical protein